MVFWVASVSSPDLQRCEVCSDFARAALVHVLVQRNMALALVVSSPVPLGDQGQLAGGQRPLPRKGQIPKAWTEFRERLCRV